jgi:hypothetical protein
MEVGNPLAYYDMATITAVKSFIVQGPGRVYLENLKVPKLPFGASGWLDMNP